MTEFLKEQSKRILYTARKKTNISSKDVCFGKYNRISNVQKALTRLTKKGLLFQDNVPLRGSSSEAVYWLTPKGIKIAEKIAKEIDEYKRW